MPPHPSSEPIPDATIELGEGSQRRASLHGMLFPIHTATTAAAPILVGGALAAHDGLFAALPLLAAFFASWSIHAGGVLLDNLYLLLRHPGVAEHPELNANVAAGQLSVARLRVVMLACFLLPLLLVPWFWQFTGWKMAIFGLIGLAASASYAGANALLARSGLADLVFLLMFGTVAVAGTYFAQASYHLGPDAPLALLVPLHSLLAGLPVGALVTAVLVIDDIRDVEFDRAKGWRTPAIRFGRRFSRAEFLLLTLAAYATPVILYASGERPATILAPLLFAPLAVVVTLRVLRADSFAALLPMSKRAALHALGFAALYAVGLLG